MVQDACAFLDQSVFDHSIHDRGKRHVDRIGILMPERNGEARLRVCIDEQHLLSLKPRQTDAEIHGGGRFSDTALLVSDSNYFAVVHWFSSFFDELPSAENRRLCTGMKKPPIRSGQTARGYII